MNLGSIIIDQEMLEALGPAFLNSIGYMFTWGTAYNWGVNLQALLIALSGGPVG